ncbi:MAG: ATP-binding cassette domain-containing protein [Acidimicrobiales bacterium]
MTGAGEHASSAVAVSDDIPVIEARRIGKRYGPIRALHDVSLTVGQGEVVGLLGDNGAGKSTLVNILSGAIPPSSGTILVSGEPVRFHSSLDARERGIETVYQDLALAPDLSVWQNLFLGREKTVRGPLGALGWLDKRYMARQAGADLDRTRIRIPSVSAECGTLSGGQRQAVAVARAVAWGSRVVLLDEPTAALGVEQQDQVAEVIHSLRGEGMAILLITHNLPQAMAICDRALVMFRGELTANLSVAATTTEELVMRITGKRGSDGDRD